MTSTAQQNKSLPSEDESIAKPTIRRERWSRQARHFLLYLAKSNEPKTIMDFVRDEHACGLRSFLAKYWIKRSIKNSLERMAFRLYKDGLLLRQRSRDGKSSTHYYEYSLSPQGFSMTKAIDHRSLRPHPRHDDEEPEALGRIGAAPGRCGR